MVVITGVKPSNVRNLYSLFYRNHTDFRRDVFARWMILVYEYCCYTVSVFSFPVLSIRSLNIIIYNIFYSRVDSESSSLYKLVIDIINYL